jgi:hypothetical protein
VSSKVPAPYLLIYESQLRLGSILMTWIVLFILLLLIIFIVAMALAVGFVVIKITEWISQRTI